MIVQELILVILLRNLMWIAHFLRVFARAFVGIFSFKKRETLFFEKTKSKEKIFVK